MNTSNVMTNTSNVMTNTSTHSDDPKTVVDTRYNRVLTAKDLTLLGLSMTVGSGIFVLIDDVAKNGKNLMWLSMLLAGIISLLTALGYGELASMFKNNMGESDYIRSVSNDKVANIMGIIILISDIFIISTVALGLGQYISTVIPSNVILTALVSIIILNYLNYKGIKTATNVSNMALYIKLAVICLIIITSVSSGQPKENIINTKGITSNGLCTGSLIALFAYLGFNNLTNFSEETINPAVNIGKSITYTMIIVTIIYTVLLISAMFVMTSSELSHSTTPLASLFGKLFGSYGYAFFIVLAIVSLLDTLLVTSVSESRYIHAILSHIYPTYGKYDMDSTHQTPYMSIILLCLLSICIIFFFKKIGSTAIFGDLLILIVFVVVNIIVIILRFTKPDETRKFKVPFNLGKIPIPSVIAIIGGLYAIYHHLRTYIK